MFKTLFLISTAILAGLSGSQGLKLYQNVKRPLTVVSVPVRPSVREAVPAARRLPPNYHVIIERNPFTRGEPKAPAAAVPLPAPLPVQRVPAANPTVRLERELAAQQPKFKLIGTMTRGREGSAVITLDTSEQKLYKPGDQITADTRLIEIGKEWVALERGGSKIVLSLKLDQDESARPAPRMETPVSRTVRRGKTAPTAPRVETPPAITSLAQLGPITLPDGRHGLRVFAMRPESPLVQAGLKDGDVILRVNGNEARDPSELYQAFQLTGQSINIDVVRDNQELTLSYVPSQE